MITGWEGVPHNFITQWNVGQWTKGAQGGWWMMKRSTVAVSTISDEPKEHNGLGQNGHVEEKVPPEAQPISDPSPISDFSSPAVETRYASTP